MTKYESPLELWFLSDLKYLMLMGTTIESSHLEVVKNCLEYFQGVFMCDMIFLFHNAYTLIAPV